MDEQPYFESKTAIALYLLGGFYTVTHARVEEYQMLQMQLNEEEL